MTDGVVETYTWAGHTRVRATSLVEGGLRGPGFVEITNSSEDQILDIGAKYLGVFSSCFLKTREKYTYGTIQVLHHQKGGWVGSDNGNF